MTTFLLSFCQTVFPVTGQLGSDGVGPGRGGEILQT